MSSRFLVVLSLLLAVASCKREREREHGTTTITSAEIQQSTLASIDRIAGARCEREVACDHVGPARQHASFDTCRDLNRAEGRHRFAPDACPQGIEPGRVVDCVAAIERASCLDPVDAIERIEACRPGRLCPAGERP